MSNKEKPPCERVFGWLKNNLGKHCLAVLTGTDWRALQAAVQILDLYGYCDSEHEASILQAFGSCVMQMQPGAARELAYHAIAMQAEWYSRAELWARAGLPPFSRVRICAFDFASGGRGENHFKPQSRVGGAA
jgi:hypothetical protein